MEVKLTRNSNVELLRIISIFVIVLSHVVGGANLFQELMSIS